MKVVCVLLKWTLGCGNGVLEGDGGDGRLLPILSTLGCCKGILEGDGGVCVVPRLCAILMLGCCNGNLEGDGGVCMVPKLSL